MIIERLENKIQKYNIIVFFLKFDRFNIFENVTLKHENIITE